MTHFGHFEGDVITKWLRDEGQKDRTMELMEDFSYVDAAGKRWLATKGRTVDGASIPAAFWSNTLGSPYVGDYRRATVLHDIGCQDRTEPHQAVHRMFLEAMRCDGVPVLTALTMFKAVDMFGPKWGPNVAFAIEPEMSMVDVAALKTATAQAVAELGEDAPLDLLDQRIDAILQQRVGPE
ncbi:MAG: DUF1353 domain-containing protein [Anaerolineae bacterium]|nr:DUF1353 domain-containing protein [Anaerolineae bacterium]